MHAFAKNNCDYFEHNGSPYQTEMETATFATEGNPAPLPPPPPLLPVLPGVFVAFGHYL